MDVFALLEGAIVADARECGLSSRLLRAGSVFNGALNSGDGEARRVFSVWNVRGRGDGLKLWRIGRFVRTFERIRCRSMVERLLELVIVGIAS